MSAQQGVPDDADPASARKAEFDQLFKQSMSSLKTSIDALPDGEGALDTYRRKRLLDEVTTDEDTTEEEFGAQPEDDDTTEEELGCCFQPPIPWAGLKPPKKSSKTAKTTPKSAKGPKTTSVYWRFWQRVRRGWVVFQVR